MKPVAIYAVRRDSGWHVTCWFAGENPCPRVQFVLPNLRGIEAKAIEEYRRQHGH